MRCRRRRRCDGSGMEAVRMLLRCHCAGERIVGKPYVTICTDTHKADARASTRSIYRVHNCVHGVCIVYVHLYTDRFSGEIKISRVFFVVAWRVCIHIQMNIQAHLHRALVRM